MGSRADSSVSSKIDKLKDKLVNKAFSAGPQTYTSWAKDYDVDHMEHYRGPALTAQEAADIFGSQKNVRIVDVCAGTGLVAEELAKYGFTNIDAIDANAEMLEAARDKNVYKNIYCSMINECLPSTAKKYDAAVACGAFYPGGLLPETILEIVKMVKKGGLVVFAVNATYDSPFKPQDFQSLMQEWERDGLLSLKRMKDCPLYVCNDKGTVYVLEVQ